MLDLSEVSRLNSSVFRDQMLKTQFSHSDVFVLNELTLDQFPGWFINHTEYEVILWKTNQ